MAFLINHNKNADNLKTLKRYYTTLNDATVSRNASSNMIQAIKDSKLDGLKNLSKYQTASEANVHLDVGSFFNLRSLD